MNNPIKDIEDRKAWMDFGRQAHMVYLGVLEDLGSNEDPKIAMSLVTAFFAGMFEGVGRNNKEDENNS